MKAMGDNDNDSLTLDRSVLEKLLEHAAAAARIAGHLDAPAVEPLADHVDALVHGLTELLGDPHLVAAPVPSARPSFDEQPTPLVTPAQAASLLDEVIYEQVVECIDLDALYRLEHSLTLLVGELDGIADDRVCKTAKAMLARALRRLPDDVWRYLRADSRPGVLPEGLLIDTIAHELGAVLGPHSKVLAMPSACSTFALAVVRRDDCDTQDDEPTEVRPCPALPPRKQFAGGDQ
jgi:hypothetical protein